MAETFLSAVQDGCPPRWWGRGKMGAGGSRKGHQAVDTEGRIIWNVTAVHSFSCKVTASRYSIVLQIFISFSFFLSLSVFVCYNCCTHTDFLPEPPCRLMKFRWVESSFNSAVRSEATAVWKAAPTPWSLSLSHLFVSTCCFLLHTYFSHLIVIALDVSHFIVLF